MGLQAIYRPGYRYAKVGVMLLDIRLMQALNAVQTRYGGFGQRWTGG